MSVTSAPASARQGSLPLLAVSLLVLVAAIAGLVFGGSLGGGKTPAARPAPAPRWIVQDGLRLQLPSGWTHGDVPNVAGFVRPLRLRNSDDGLRASVERLPATSPTLLPAAFLHTLLSAPDPPEIATLSGGRQAWRYRFPGQDSSMTLIYVAPTTSGVATVACTSPIDTSVPRACQALAAAVTVPGSRPLAPSTSAAFFTRLPSAVTDLHAARVKDTKELAAATRARGQALAANDLARAHQAAGAALAPLTHAGDGLPSATVGAVATTATAYTALATAARARAPKRYAAASRAVTGADADLRRAITKANTAETAANRAATTPVAPAKPAATATPAATAKPAATATPVAPAKPAATATPAATAKPAASATPAAAAKPSVTKPLTEVAPVASAAHGADLSVVILLLLGVTAIFFAVRQTIRLSR